MLNDTVSKVLLIRVPNSKQKISMSVPEAFRIVIPGIVARSGRGTSCKELVSHHGKAS